MACFRFSSSTFLRHLKLAGGLRATLSLSNALPFSCSEEYLNLITKSRKLRGIRYAHKQTLDRKNDAEYRAIHGTDYLKCSNNVPDRRMIELKWYTGEEMLFPYIFLRDSCQCESCYHPFTKARLVLMKDLKVDSFPINIQVDNNSEQLIVTWDDGHVSPFTYSWLRDHSFTEEAARKQDNLFYRKPTIWGKEFQNKYPTAVFNEILNDDNVFYKWLTDIEEFGFCLIKKAPKEPGQVERLGKRISYLKTCHHGPTFNVLDKAHPSNLAYTSDTLGLHSDIPYDRYPPGVQFLHCITQASCGGGENQFSDSFYTAKVLEMEYPEYYRLLCTAPIDFIDVGKEYYGEFFKLGRHPVFTKDMAGNVASIQCSHQCRDSYMKLPVDQVEPMIRALRKLDDTLYENHITVKMEEGDIVTFTNRRVLHGRTGYKVNPQENRQRHLEGAYLDLDEINSRRRALKQKLGFGVRAF